MSKSISKTVSGRTLLIFVLMAAGMQTALAQNADYSAVVKLVESHYHVKHRGTPFIATWAVKAVHPQGVRDFKMATFEDQDFSATSDAEFALAVRRLLTPTWQPLIQVRSRQDAAQTYVYLKEAGENFKVMVVTIERRDATVLQAEVSPQTLAKWLKEPDKIGRTLSDASAGDAQEE